MFYTVCSTIALVCVLTLAYCTMRMCEMVMEKANEKEQKAKAERDAIGRSEAKRKVQAEATKKRNSDEVFAFISGEKELYK